MAQRAGFVGQAPNLEWGNDRVVIFGLNLALEETIQHLFIHEPDFASFEQWVLDKNGGRIDPECIARINAAISGSRNGSACNSGPAVLSAAHRAHFEEHGYVVVHDAVTRSQCAAVVQTIARHLNFTIEDPDSWYAIARDHGIMHQLFHDPALCEVRDSRRIHQAFAQLWGTGDLWVTVDRVSMNPPERNGWRFTGPRLHWDTSLEPPIPFGLQGLVYLTNTAAEQGAFTCVPGFHRRIDNWLQSLPPETDPRQIDLSPLAVPVPGRAGDLIIWHQALPHGSRPNTAGQPRFVQYVYLFPVDEEHEIKWK